MKVKLLGLFISLILSACGSASKTKLSEGGQNVRVLTARGFQGCEVVDKFVGENDKGSEALAKNHARNQAAKVGANAIIFNEVVGNAGSISVYATAYQCP